MSGFSNFERESLYIHKELSGFKSVSLSLTSASLPTSEYLKSPLQYVKRFSRYKNPDAVRQVREILSRYQLAEFELCVLGNLCPETVEEAIAMVPSIKTKGRAHDDEAIEKMLNDLSLIKKFE
ncbi:DNA-directed RNA polymerase II subunit 4 [Vitis vinifera]|uniref:DNA-directed RNA polymerase II subunit 4 n=1 Tax=Vitis vinifera TaxID=29760 RepID=A0A438HN33_VITVI|nr:DNA-directed RNA polymerase II subunit 4 [Vitis vinifera]